MSTHEKHEEEVLLAEKEGVENQIVLYNDEVNTLIMLSKCSSMPAITLLNKPSNAH